MAWAMTSNVAAVFLLTFTPMCYSAVIQASIEIDTGVNDLLEILMKKFDSQERGQQTKKMTSDLATTLLKAVPLLSIKGNITDKSRGFTINFSFQASSPTAVSISNGLNSALLEKQEYAVDSLEEYDIMLQPLVETLQLYVMQGVVLVIEGILGVVIGRIIENACFL